MTSAAAPPDTSIGLVETHEERVLRETVRGIAADFGPSYFREAAEKGSAPELWRALCEPGFFGAHLPSEYGGGGLGLLELAAAVEESSAAGCPVVATLYSPGVVASLLAAHGTAEQKQRWVPGLANGEIKASFAITEPDAGSNSHNLATTARREGDAWVINGNKQFISGADEADILMVVARTGRDEGSGRGLLSVFVIDANSPGLTRQPMPTALQAPERQFTLFFDGVEAGPDALVGREDGGLQVAFSGMNVERILTGSICVGVGSYALEKAVAYAKERSVWGKPIGSHQAVSHPLARSKVELDSARLLIRRACALHDAGDDAAEASNVLRKARRSRGRAQCPRPRNPGARRQRGRGQVRALQLLVHRPDPADRPGLPGDGPQLRGRAGPRPPALY